MCVVLECMNVEYSTIIQCDISQYMSFPAVAAHFHGLKGPWN